MTQKSEIGKRGEDLACEYLVNKGYKIVERNFRRPWGEIDIIAVSADKTLVFVEVKTMRENLNLRPEDNLSRAKFEKVQRTSAMYVGSYPEKVKNKKGWRIDLVAISIGNDLTIKSNNYSVNHLENISFEV